MSIITGIDDIVLEEFAMYPNPFTGNILHVTVNNPNHVESFVIINGSGKVIKTEQLTNRNNTVDISDLTNGIYIVKIAYKNNSCQIEKLIVK